MVPEFLTNTDTGEILIVRNIVSVQRNPGTGGIYITTVDGLSRSWPTATWEQIAKGFNIDTRWMAPAKAE